MTFLYVFCHVACVIAIVEQQKKADLMRLRHEAQHDRKAHAMASRTKDNLQVFTDGKTTEAEEEPVVDLKHLFTKHDRRVPHLPSDKIPDMLAMMKKRQKQRHVAREEAKKAAAAAAAEAEAETVKVMQRKADAKTSDSEFKQKKIFPSLQATSGEMLHSSSGIVRSKSDSTDRSVESKGIVKKKNLPPPMSFGQLMALAEQKQAEPALETQPSNLPKKVRAEEGQRPMTQEEKERQKRRETKEYQHWLKHGGPPPSSSFGGKSLRHLHHSGKSHKGQSTTFDTVILSESESSDEGDAETDETCNIPPQEVDTKKSFLHSATNRLKDGTDVTHKYLPAVKSTGNSGKFFHSQNNYSQQPLDRSRPFSRGEVMFTKGKVVLGKAIEAGQNGKSKSLSDELMEKLMAERRKMADRGDAVPSLDDMLQDLLNKVCGKTNSQESTTKHSFLSETRPSSNNTKSKVSVPGVKFEPAKSGVSRSQTVTATESRALPQYVAVNETVVDCIRDKSSSIKPGAKPVDKRLTKSTWEEMYERAKSKNSNHDQGILLNCIYCIFHCVVYKLSASF